MTDNDTEQEEEKRRQAAIMAAPTVRCVKCGWCHVGTAPPEYAPDVCFRCKGFLFEVIDDENAPRGVTLQAVRWPPIQRPPTIPKDQLTAADIMLERKR